MALVDELGFEPKEPNVVQRALQTVASTRPGAWTFSKTLRHIDRFVTWATRGRTTAPEVLAAMPVILVTTTGAKTGKRRTSPLAGVPVDGNLAIVGTNFGGERTPGWYHNLRADPEAEVGYRGRTARATAREAEGEERDRILDRADGVYTGFSKYQDRIEDREVHVMVLEAP